MPTHIPSLFNTKFRKNSSTAINSAHKASIRLRITATNPDLHHALEQFMITTLRGEGHEGMDVCRLLVKVRSHGIKMGSWVGSHVFENLWKKGPFNLIGSRLVYDSSVSPQRNDVNAGLRYCSSTSQAIGGLADSLRRTRSHSREIDADHNSKLAPAQSKVPMHIHPKPRHSKTPPFYAPGDDAMPSSDEVLYDLLARLIAGSGAEAYCLKHFLRQVKGYYSKTEVKGALSRGPFTVSHMYVSYNPSMDSSPTRPKIYHSMKEVLSKSSRRNCTRA